MYLKNKTPESAEKGGLLLETLVGFAIITSLVIFVSKTISWDHQEAAQNNNLVSFNTDITLLKQSLQDYRLCEKIDWRLIQKLQPDLDDSSGALLAKFDQNQPELQLSESGASVTLLKVGSHKKYHIESFSLVQVSGMFPPPATVTEPNMRFRSMANLVVQLSLPKSKKPKTYWMPLTLVSNLEGELKSCYIHYSSKESCYALGGIPNTDPKSNQACKY